MEQGLSLRRDEQFGGAGNGLFEWEAGRLDGWAVPGENAGEIEIRKAAAALKRRGIVPGGPFGQGKKPGRVEGKMNSAEGDQGVTGVQTAVALVKKGKMTGCVSGRRDDAERSDSVIFANQQIGQVVEFLEAAFDRALGFVWKEVHLGRLDAIRGFDQELRVALACDQFCLGKDLFQGVDGACVIHVAVCQKDAANSLPQMFGCLLDDTRGRQGGIDHREAVVLANQVAVHRIEAANLQAVIGDSTNRQKETLACRIADSMKFTCRSLV